MRKGVWLALIASVGASAWVLLSAPSTALPTGVVVAREHGGASGSTAPNQPLPARWDAPMLETARRNPFAADAPPSVAKAAPASAPPPMLVVVQAPPVPPAPPPVVALPFTYRYLGRMIDPQGQRVLYVARGDVVVTVEVGTQLNDGYTVEAVSDSSIEVVNPATQQRHTIAIPPDANTTAKATTTP